MVFLKGRPVTSWSRSQKSIALSSCESEYLAAVGGGAEGIHIGRLWTLLVRKETEVSVVTDSSSCRAFAQRQGVGRLKHIETKYLWLQQCVNLGILTMTGGFLMFLMGMVFFDESNKVYMPVGEEEFNEEMGKKTLGKSMKAVRPVMLNTLSDGAEGLQVQISKPMVKLMTLLAMQPMVDGIDVGIIELKAMEAKFAYLNFLHGAPGLCGSLYTLSGTSSTRSSLTRRWSKDRAGRCVVYNVFVVDENWRWWMIGIQLDKR